MDKTGRAPGSPMEPELQEFHTGAAAHAYRTFGCHALPGAAEHRFAVWAPHAQRVTLVGDFNGWDIDATPMDRLPDGTWMQTVDGLRDGALYKYAVTGADGQTVLKADPFAAHCETGPATASKVWSLEGYVWHDRSYLRRRAERDVYRAPMSIYEVHLGSWRQRGDRGCRGYRSVADELADYCRKMHYTHVELLPVTEYPYEGSWGYQVTGYYAPTSRYGTPQDFMYFVDKLHREGIGVIMDWVPAHFPQRRARPARALTARRCYECKRARAWQSTRTGARIIFDYAMPQVQSFLISLGNAVLRQIPHRRHPRGRGQSSHALPRLRPRAAASGRPTSDGGNINLRRGRLPAKAQLHRAHGLPRRHDHRRGVVTAFPLRDPARPMTVGSASCFKWDMGFMHDTLDYHGAWTPTSASYHHNRITFSMMYAFSENFILAFSHDEVVHGKKSMVDKMWGDVRARSLPRCARSTAISLRTRARSSRSWAAEFGQFIEWNYKQGLDWLPARLPHAQGHAALVQRAQPPATMAAARSGDIDDGWDGFTWLNVDDAERSAIAFLRTARNGRYVVVCVCNFTPVRYDDFVIGLPKRGVLRELLSSDAEDFGGAGIRNAPEIRSEDVPFGALPCCARR